MAKELRRINRPTDAAVLPKKYVNMFCMDAVRQKAAACREVYKELTIHSPVPSYADPLVTPTTVSFPVEECDLRRTSAWVSIRERRSLACAVAQHVVRGLLSALVVLEKHNLVHGNLSLDTVMLDGGGRIRLSGFLVVPGFYAKGSPLHKRYCEYAAPEILSNSVYSRDADIWGIGVTLVQLLVVDTQSKFSSEDLADANVIAPMLNGLTPEVVTFCVSCLKKDPNERPRLAELLDHPFVKTRPRPASQPTTSYMPKPADGDDDDDDSSDEDTEEEEESEEDEEESEESSDDDDDDDDEDDDAPPRAAKPPAKPAVKPRPPAKAAAKK